MQPGTAPRGLWAIVLAAGESRRLGRPKQLVRWRNDTLIGHSVRNAQTLCGERVRVVLGAYAPAIEAALAGAAPALVMNAQWQEGIASSLRMGVAALPSGCEAALLLTCDQPRVPLGALEALVQRWRDVPDCAVASAYAGTVGIPAILPARAFGALLQLSGDRGARAVLTAERERLETVPVPEAAFDVDDEHAVRALESDETEALESSRGA